MTDLVVIVPSRGRPEAARTLAMAFEKTCTAETLLLFAVDDNDPALGDYIEHGLAGRVATWQFPSRNMGEALRFAVQDVIGGDPFAVGFMGDDHMPRTVGWDAAYLAALRELGTGIVYGDDLLQGRGLPTQCAMTADIIRALGYMAPPELIHMYFDNFWLSLGNKAGCIRYLPDVVVEHRHPVAGKAAIDEGYARVNSQAVHAHDERVFLAYIESVAFNTDVAKVQALRAAHV